MKKTIIFALAALLMTASCAKLSKTELYSPDESLKTTGEVTLCLSVEDLSTKLAVDKNGHFLFEANDTIMVLLSDNSYVKFYLDGTGDTKRAFFKGTVPAGKTIGKYVVYPCSVAGTCDGSKLKVVLPDVVKYGEGFSSPMVGAIGNDYYVKMHQLCSYTKITVNSFPGGVSEVEFKDSVKTLAGEYDYDLAKLGTEGISAKDGGKGVRFVMTAAPSAPVFEIPCAIGDYNNIRLSLYDEKSALIGTQAVSDFPLSFARGAVNDLEMTSEIKIKVKQVVVDGENAFKLNEISTNVYEAVVDVNVNSTIALNLDSKMYGFASYSGAGGIGDCKSEFAALPYYNFTANHTQLYHVERAIGEVSAIDNGGNNFWVNLTAPGKVRVVYDANYGVSGSYYLELVKDDDPKVVLDESFDLFTCGGDIVWVLQGSQYGSDPASYDGISAATPKKANWNASGSKNVMWDYPTKVASDVVSKTYMTNRGVADWEFARVDERPGALQLNNGNDCDSYMITPKLSKLEGTTDINLTVEIARYSSTSHSELYVEVLGGGEFISGHVEQPIGTAFQSMFTDYKTRTSHDFTSLSGTKFTIDETYCVCVPTAGNTVIYKPVSTFDLKVKGATPSTRIKVSAPFVSNNPPRCAVYGIKITK